MPLETKEKGSLLLWMPSGIYRYVREESARRGIPMTRLINEAIATHAQLQTK